MGHKKTTNTDIIWMSREVMDREVGAFKAKTWRDSGRMKPQPDQLTGSMHEDCAEWSMPKRWSRMSQGEFKRFWFTLTGDATAEDYAGFDNRFVGKEGRVPGGCATSDAAVKVEELTTDELRARNMSLKRLKV